MPWTFTCECGEKLAADTEGTLVGAARRHVAESHPAVGVAPSAADVIAMAEWSGDEETASGGMPVS